MRHAMTIAGAREDGPLTLEVVNPATGTAFAECARGDAATLERAIDAAAAAAPSWAAAGYVERRTALLRWADTLDARMGEMARLLTAEQGKPIPQATYEVGGAIAALRYFAEQRLEPVTLRDDKTGRIIEHRLPLGIVAAITPWNFPVILLMLKVAPALITGNCVIAKPAPTTPLTTALLGETSIGVLPAGVFQTLIDANDLGAALAAHPRVAQVSFTGSTATGRKVLAGTAATIKRSTLELGGNDPAIILEDVDLAAAAPAIFAAATLNAGQVCLAAKRIYAPASRYDEICEALGGLARDAVVGDGSQQGSEIGPIQNAAQLAKLRDYLAEAERLGTVVAKGQAPAGEGFFFPPVVVRDLPDDARVVREEQFGPIIPVLRYEKLDDAIARANDSEYGLGATVWTADPAAGEAVARRIDSGTVWVNRHMDLPFDVPFGGAKQSGIGRQQGLAGLKEFTQAKIVNIAR